MPNGLIIQDLPEYARNQFPEYMDSCVREWAGIKDKIPQKIDYLVVDSMSDWVRDLTSEGIEPNPGPPKCRPNGESRPMYTTGHITGWDTTFWRLPQIIAEYRPVLYRPIMSLEPAFTDSFWEAESSLELMREFVVPLPKTHVPRLMLDLISKSCVALERIYLSIRIVGFRIDLNIRDEISNIHCRLNYQTRLELRQLEQSITLLSRKKMVVEDKRYCLYGDDIIQIVSMYPRKGIIYHLYVVGEIPLDDKYLKITTA